MERKKKEGPKKEEKETKKTKEEDTYGEERPKDIGHESNGRTAEKAPQIDE